MSRPPGIRAAILDALLAVGDLTDEQLGDELAKRAVSFDEHSIRKRRDDLVKAGDVIDTGYRRLTRSGRAGIVWHAVVEDEPYTVIDPPQFVDELDAKVAAADRIVAHIKGRVSPHELTAHEQETLFDLASGMPE